MKFKRLRFCNFRSFTGEHTFSFASEPGLCFVDGRNELEPSLGSNGSGKSSIWEALEWVCYGRTSHGLRAQELLSWGEEKRGYWAELEAEEGVLYRSWSPNSLMLNGEPVDQPAVNEWLGLTQVQFNQSVFMAQFTALFLDLSHQERASIFSDVLDLNEWVVRSDKARAGVRTKEAEGNERGRALEKLNGMILAITDRLASMDVHAQEWEKRRQEDLTAIDKELDSAHANLVRAENDRDTHRLVCDAARAALNEVLKDKVAAGRREQDMIRLHTAAQSAVAAVQRDIDRVQEEAAFFRANDVCVLCHQPITSKHREHTSTRLGERLTALEAELAKKKAEVETARIAASSARAELEVLTDDEAKVRLELERATMLLNSAMSQVQINLSAGKKLMADHDRMKIAPNPHLAEKNEVRRDLSKKKIAAADLQKELVVIQEQVEMLKFWTRGFLEIRLFLISEALQQLEMEVSASLLQLGLDGWQVKFSIDRDTASGTVKSGLFISVIAPDAENSVSVAAYSGGESQRLRLAVTMGLSNLLLNSLGLDVNVEIWDEPSTWMSDQGVEDLLDALYLRASSLKKQIWVVDHRTLDFGGFSSVATVVKDKHGVSHIEQ